jgi:hypothetical protein
MGKEYNLKYGKVFYKDSTLPMDFRDIVKDLNYQADKLKDNKKVLIKEINIQIKHHKNELNEVELKTEVTTINCVINSLKHLKECIHKLD